MSEQYYTKEPTSASKPVDCSFAYRGHGLIFSTDAGVFSKGELDEGTRLLLDNLPQTMNGDVLDLGCGWGPIGIGVAKTQPSCRVVMADVNRRALSLTEENLRRNGVSAECVESDGMASLRTRSFDAIITNPPIRAGKQVIYAMFADAAAAMKPGGGLYLVIRKQQGAESCVRYLRSIYGEVDVLKKSGGFWVLKASAPLSEGGNSHAV